MPSRGSTHTEILIAAPIDTAWRALTQHAGRRRWMNGAEVRSTWAVGAPVAIDVVLEGEVRHDVGTVETVIAPRVLAYTLWSSISRRADTPENRSTVTFMLEAVDSGTRLSVEHEGLVGAAGPHASLFWTVAVAVLRDDLEGRTPPARIELL